MGIVIIQIYKIRLIAFALFDEVAKAFRQEIIFRIVLFNIDFTEDVIVRVFVARRTVV
jgi:hypothetical protein